MSETVVSHPVEEFQLAEPELLRVEVPIHGRLFFRPQSGGRRLPLLVGFHGYAENAVDQLKRLLAIDCSRGCPMVSIQALHPFYTRTNGEVVASWMTRQDRELALAENLEYVGRVLDRLREETRDCPSRVFCGFSQGAAMAFRTAVRHCEPASHVVVLGGEIPPELGVSDLRKLNGVLLGRGGKDRHYPAEKLDSDLARLREAGLSPESSELDAGHLWTADFSRRASEFLDGLID